MVFPSDQQPDSAERWPELPQEPELPDYSLQEAIADWEHLKKLDEEQRGA